MYISIVVLLVRGGYVYCVLKPKAPAREVANPDRRVPTLVTAAGTLMNPWRFA